ncbi:hypothetical protein HGRIS_010043 [Hohenbuehelia grisea]|uniref:Uncharacterized protein n=1 Tax=Hohenbuehelia grisea TaxID=104357 RepID=A0ABR3J4I9_9AGAR
MAAAPEPIDNPSTDYGAFVVKVVAQMTRDSQAIDQATLRYCIGLSSTYLMSDTVMNPEGGLATWFTGFNQLVELIIALHSREELELETMNAASKACSECWTVGGGWRGLEDSREYVRKMAAKLKTLLDDGGRTYKGQRVYAP